MKYDEALKQVKSEKTKENYLLVKLDYNKYMVLPYKDGLLFISSMVNAEILNESYNEPKGIHPMARDQFETCVLSRHEYEQYKIATLMGLSIDEVKAAEEASKKSTTEAIPF